MLQTRGADKRLYNPDRDMIWAMPRLMLMALKGFGENITAADIRNQLRRRSFYDWEGPTDSEIDDNVGLVVTEFAKYLNDLKEDPETRRNPAERYNKLFKTDDVIYCAIRSLMADYLMGVIYAEMPIWFESIQPENESNPVPRTEEVSKFVEKLLGRSTGSAAEEDADDGSA